MLLTLRRYYLKSRSPRACFRESKPGDAKEPRFQLGLRFQLLLEAVQLCLHRSHQLLSAEVQFIRTI